jgi:hypothetical protein
MTYSFPDALHLKSGETLLSVLANCISSAYATHSAQQHPGLFLLGWRVQQGSPVILQVWWAGGV